MSEEWFKVRVDAEPEHWRPSLTIGGCAYIMTVDEADELSRRLAEAATETRRKNEIERALPLAERVWLYLARLCHADASSIAHDFDVPEACVAEALASLADAGRARLVFGYTRLFEAIDRSDAR